MDRLRGSQGNDYADGGARPAGLTGGPVGPGRWWESRAALAGFVLLLAVPLLWPATPPLVDLPGHLSRYRVELDLAHSASLQRYFAFHWRLIGNMGVDLLMVPFGRLLGVEAGLKAIVVLMPPLTALAFLLISREVHGRVQPTALFALPFIYSFPFNSGFLNFSLSLAVGLLSFWVWLRLSGREAWKARAAAMAPLSCATWISHACGWGILGLLCWSSEVVRLRDRGSSWAGAGAKAAVACIPLAIPVLFMILWRQGSGGEPLFGPIEPVQKLLFLLAVLRDRWELWDCVALCIVYLLIGSAMFERHLTFARRLALPAAVLALAFAFIPSKSFGATFTDMRLVPVVIALTLLAIRQSSGENWKLDHRLASLGALFLALRIAGNTASFALGDVETKERLAALQLVRAGAPVLFLEGSNCSLHWPLPIHSHLGSFVITRRQGFSNDQWSVFGTNLSSVVYKPAGGFAIDPSQVTRGLECDPEIRKAMARDRVNGVQRAQSPVKTADEALDLFPRAAFDYVWLVKPAGFTPRPRAGLQLIWRGRDSFLYRVNR